MNNQYSERITKLIVNAQPTLFAIDRVEFKNVFGAVGGYLNGRLFISCGKFGIALKLPSDLLNILFQDKDVKHLKYFPKGHTKKEYAILPNRILEDIDQLSILLDKSMKYVQSI